MSLTLDPATALQTLIGDTLAADPAVVAHVQPGNIRAGSIRDEQLPAIILAPARASILGRAGGAQIVAEVRAHLHIWAHEDATGTAQELAAAVLAALMDAPTTDAFTIDAWDRPALEWLRDPAPDETLTHGVIATRATIRWRAD